jgi:DNA invertase Pin-like site-specific DNA recombinase
MAPKLIGLVRVSTDKQGESGLGLDAQLAAIEAYRAMVGGELIKTYVEVESGMHDDVDSRPQLRAAAGHAAFSKARLVIAKIDRLVRSTVVMAYLKKLGVQFVACDNPHANELTIDILVAVAADEGRRISLRTRDALRPTATAAASRSGSGPCTRTASRRRSSRPPPASSAPPCRSAATSPTRPGPEGPRPPVSPTAAGPARPMAIWSPACASSRPPDARSPASPRT